ncbi:MAG: iron-containing alcohol dehydrogenase [Clostridia bacterium]|nr:iron-containing alcohol dehydrogenase [Clostridia bacterium]
MSEIMEIVRSFRGVCPSCGREHRTAIEDVRIGSGVTHCVGDILKENGFTKKLLLVADRNTLRAADGIMESLSDFDVETHIYDDIRVATMEHVEELEALLCDREISVLSVGTGSVNDPCRLASARQNKKLCIFATAPSMDGFASYSSPIVAGGFKSSYAAKSPEVIIGDTKILAAAPTVLKSSGFGDMVAKYPALIDWQIASLLTDEMYCERIAALTRAAIDRLMEMADRVTVDDEETAGAIFASLLLTGIGMSFAQNSRPASGAEHIIAHLMECVELRDGIIPNFHGEDIGVCTLYTLQFYGQLAERETIEPHCEEVDWEDIYRFYGSMADDVRAINADRPQIAQVTPDAIKAHWQQIRAIIRSVPSYAQCAQAMRRAGCKMTLEEIGKSQKLFDDCVKYSPYMRNRLTILRLRGMLGV